MEPAPLMEEILSKLRCSLIFQLHRAIFTTLLTLASKIDPGIDVAVVVKNKS